MSAVAQTRRFDGVQEWFRFRPAKRRVFLVDWSRGGLCMVVENARERQNDEAKVRTKTVGDRQNRKVIM